MQEFTLFKTLVQLLELLLLLLLLLVVTTPTAADEKSSRRAPSLTNTTFHVLSIPHTVLRQEFSPCPFTLIVARHCRMLKGLGLHSVLYANDGSDHECDTMETILSKDERIGFYGDDNTWKAGKWFKTNVAEGTALFGSRAVKAIHKQMEQAPDKVHVLLSFYGVADYEIATQTGLTTIEASIGYDNSWATYRVYPSYHWMTAQTAKEGVNHYHAVIPNCFFADEFQGAVPVVSEEDGPYFLFVGRIMESKGLYIVVEIMRNMPDHKLHLAGQGNWESFFADEDESLRNRVVYHGVLGPKERNNLMIGAEALIAPTTYKEPFGNVMVEAQWLGVPVITTDHATFAETVWHGVTGFRCRTLRCFVGAAKRSRDLDRKRIAARARQTYDCERLKYSYEDYYRDVLDLYDEHGWSRLEAGEGHTLDQKDFYPSGDESECSANVL